MASAFLGTTVRGIHNAAVTVPIIKMGNLTWGELNLTNVEALARFCITDDRHWLRAGDFLFNTRNTPELVGKTAVYRGGFDRCTYDNNLLCVRFKGGLDSRFVCQYMSHGIGQQRVFAMATGTTSVAAIYWSALAKYRLPVPKDPQESVAIANRVDALRDRVAAETAHLAKLRQLKHGLMQDLLTGRVPVLA
jgi:type I restriction enzyme S subunit